MGDDRVSIGFVVGLDYTDATVSGHDLLQQFKTSKLVRRILEGGERVAWGAKAIPEGGYWAMPKLSAPGMVIAGDAGGMVNVPVLKGIHYAIHAGILAAEQIFEQLKRGSNDFSGYEQAVEDSLIGKELYQSRNMKQPFGKGFFVGGAITNAMVISKGRFPGGRWSNHRDAESPVEIGDKKDGYPKPDGKYTFDKLSSVYITGNATRDDAPNHIRVRENVPREVAEAWAWMCPAGVYEVPEDAPARGQRRRDRQLHQLRAVRGDHGQGRAADHARGRRRPAVPGDLAPAARNLPGPGLFLGAHAPRRRSSSRSSSSRCPPPRRPRPRRCGSSSRRARAGRRPPARTATFVGSMPAIAGTRRMWMRFDLFARVAPASGFAAVKAPKLGVWQKSAPGRVSSGFVFTQRVQGLTAPGSFRAQVRFRWYGSRGRLLRSATRTSATCKQPDQRADLRAGTLDAVRTHRSRAGHLRARGAQRRPHGGRPVRRRAHRRRGRAAARARARRAGRPAPPPRSPSWRRAVRPARRCASTLDAEDEVDESGKLDDVVERACP